MMSKSPRRRGPLEQYDKFMLGSTNSELSKGPRGPLLVVGSIVGNTLSWLLGLITVARLGTLFAFFVVAAVTLGILQRLAPTLELGALLLVSAIIGLIVVTIAVMVLKVVLRRDAQRLNQQAVFGVGDEDARSRDRQNYRRKSGR
jgi:hypothetical protein